MAVAFANIFMAAVETKILSQNETKPLVWKRYIDDVFSLWNTSIEEINGFIVKANGYHQTIIKNLRLKYQRKRLFSWIHAFTKVIDLKKHLSLTCAPITSRQKHFSTRISLPATHQGSVEAS